MPPRRRLHELDSLRGLAVLSVMLNHLVVTLHIAPKLWTGWSPFHLLAGGHEAVVCFFVLSGFVLSLPYWSGRNHSYPRFAIRRYCRIYIPYAVALGVAVTLAWVRSHGRVSASDVWDHILLLGNYNFERFNYAFWSLVYEMRISLLFPALMFVLIRWPLAAWPLALASSAAYAAASALWPQSANYAATAHYAGFFLIGAWLAREHQRIGTCYASLPLPARIGVNAAALLLYCYGHRASSPILSDWIVSLGATALVVSVLHSPVFREWPGAGVVEWIGDRSYSLYLLHFPVLAAIVYWLGSRLSVPAMAILFFAIALLGSAVSYKLVELPAIRLGAWWTRERKASIKPKAVLTAAS